ncbi:MAG: sensor histidine kinase, partial [Chloroflexota bacterium]
GIPTRETGFVMYRGIVSVSIWDSENNLIHVTPSNLETEISELSGPQKEVLDWALHDSLRPHTNFVASGGIPKISSFHTDPSSRIKTEVVPLLNNDKTEVLGAVLVQTGPPGFFYIDPTFYLVSLGVLLGCLLFAFLGSFLISRNLRKRISSLQSYTSTWSDGNLSVRAEDSSTDEIGRLTADLNQMASQLEELIDAKSLLASVETRQQLARDLHDAAKQQLFAANMQLSAVNSLIETEPQRARTHLDNASDLTKQAQEELSAVIDQLRPIQLRDSTFLAAVKQLIAETQKHQPINIQLDANITAPFTDTAEQDLFRVLQEALNNIIKHSYATQVTLVLDHTASHTQLVVQDNGKGFDPSNQSSGFGLKSMKERVRQLGGSFDIQSGDNGTKITIEISEGKTLHE